jgi:hypothetical protein
MMLEFENRAILKEIWNGKYIGTQNTRNDEQKVPASATV